MLLRRGSSGDQVANVQRRLLAAGHDLSPADGLYGPRTEAAVREFQAAQGLVADGIVGITTWSALLSGGAIIVRPEVRRYGWRVVRLWHAVVDRRRARARSIWADDPVAVRARNDARRDGRTEPWRRLPLTHLAAGHILAINSAFFDTLSGWPIGPTIEAGQPINGGMAIPPDQYVVVVTEPDLSLAQESPNVVYDLIALGVRQAFSTIPMLVRGGRKQIGGHDAAHHGPAPRTLLGWSDTEIHVVTIDGRRPWWSGGVTMEEAANLLLEYGCREGVNLDSGGSAEMVLAGEVVNRPSDGSERPLPAALVFELI